MALLRFTATIGSYTLASRVLGYVRDILIASMLGASPVADAFFVAFKIPNLLRRLFAEGAFNLAFVPEFAGRLETQGRAAAKAYAEAAFAMLLWVLVAVVGVAEIAMPWLMYALAPGFGSDAAKFDLAVELTRITFPYILFVSIVSLLGGVLNSLHRFAAAAAAPLLLNASLIVALLALSSLLPTPGHALALGVFAAGLVQLAWLWAFCVREGFTLRLRRPRITPEMRKLLLLMAPVALGAGVQQLSVVIDMIFVSTIGGGVAFLYYADRVSQLPLGVIGVALGTALLPMLARDLRAQRLDRALHQQNRAAELALATALPAAVALVLLAYPIMTVLFERGAFDAHARAESARALIGFAVGLPAFVLVKVLIPGFFARGEAKPAVRIAVLCMAVNAGLNAALIGSLGAMGVALATSLSGWLNAGLLYGALRRRGYFTLDRRLRARGPRILLASAGLAGGLALMRAPLGAAFAAEDLALRGAALGALVVAGLLAYGLLAWALGVLSRADLERLLTRPARPRGPAAPRLDPGAEFKP